MNQYDCQKTCGGEFLCLKAMQAGKWKGPDVVKLQAVVGQDPYVPSSAKLPMELHAKISSIEIESVRGVAQPE